MAEKESMPKKERKNRKPKEKSIEKKQSINYWKVAFLALVGIIAGIILFLGIRVTQVREPDYKPTEVIDMKGSPVLNINTKKKQVNAMIDFFLNDNQKGSNIDYRFYLENDAMLAGTFKVLGYPIEFNLYFDPYVMDNGNVQLKAKSLSIGALGLPIKEILEFVKRDYNLPEWIEVNAKEKYILLRLDQFKMANGLYMKADKINLVDDDIQVSIYIPDNGTTSSTAASTTE